MYTHQSTLDVEYPVILFYVIYEGHSESL